MAAWRKRTFRILKLFEKFLEFLNCYHPTIKFTAHYSKEKRNFLDVSVRKTNNQLVTDLYIKPTDTHQYLHASSCHVYHSKISIPYSQALHLNRICSENSSYNKRCNELEVWLKGSHYWFPKSEKFERYSCKSQSFATSKK